MTMRMKLKTIHAISGNGRDGNACYRLMDGESAIRVIYYNPAVEGDKERAMWLMNEYACGVRDGYQMARHALLTPEYDGRVEEIERKEA
jgi:hypothetical protein